MSYFRERAVVDGHRHVNTVISGTDDRYLGPNSVFLASRDNNIFLTSDRESSRMSVDLKAPDGSL